MSETSEQYLTSTFIPQFKSAIPMYRGVEKVWIGDGTNGEDGVLYAELVDGAMQNLGPVTGYYYAKKAGYTGSFSEWATILTAFAQYDIISESQIDRLFE